MTIGRIVRCRLIWVGALAGIFFLQAWFASLQKSPVGDDPPHLAASLSYIDTGRIAFNLQHPPLVKEICGLFLKAGGVEWPATAALPESTADPSLLGTIQTGLDIMQRNGLEHVMRWARFPLILMGTALTFVLYWFARPLVGEAGALGAAFLYSVDPSFLGETWAVQTDVGLALFTVVFLLTLWRYLSRPSLPRMLGCGLALGAVLGSKFSAVVLLPVAVVLIVAAARWPVEPDPPQGFGKRLVRYGKALAVIGIVAFFTLQVLYLFPRNPLLYLEGMHRVNQDHNPDYRYYLAGHLARRFYSYYVAVWLLKEPLATIALTILGGELLLRKLRPAPLARVFLLVPFLALFAGYTLFSDDLGVRYILPAMPFLLIFGGAGLATLLQHGRWQRAVGAALCIWLVVAAAGIYPDHTSYFNETACLLDNPANLGFDGGSRCGAAWLDDNNVDWGQGLQQLRAWLNLNKPGQAVYLGIYHTVPPQWYGFPPESADYPQVLRGDAAGLYAVSAEIVSRATDDPADGAWMKRTAPIAIVGHAYYIYELR